MYECRMYGFTNLTTFLICITVGGNSEEHACSEARWRDTKHRQGSSSPEVEDRANCAGHSWAVFVITSCITRPFPCWFAGKRIDQGKCKKIVFVCFFIRNIIHILWNVFINLSAKIFYRFFYILYASSMCCA